MIKQLTAKEMTVVGGVGSEYLAQIAEWVSYYIADRGCKLLEQNQVMLGLFKQYPLIEAGFPVGCFILAKSCGYYTKKAVSRSDD